MPTTSNFGWTTPADTDLVKDGASAIRTLGNGIDTSLVDLKGGTTGQVLSKASNTDLDFSWTSVDPLTILDAKGDLISATAADTPARLAVGTNGQVLTADSTQSTGLAWTTLATGSMTLLSTTSLTGASTTISSISGSYKDLVAIIYGVTNATANGRFLIRPNNATTGCFGLYANGTSLAGNGDAEVWLSGNTGTNALLRTSSENVWRVHIANYASTASTKAINVFGQYRDEGLSPRLASFFVGGYSSTSAVTSLVFLNSGGNLSTGTVLLYGVN